MITIIMMITIIIMIIIMVMCIFGAFQMVTMMPESQPIAQMFIRKLPNVFNPNEEVENVLIRKV